MAPIDEKLKERTTEREEKTTEGEPRGKSQGQCWEGFPSCGTSQIQKCERLKIRMKEGTMSSRRKEHE